MHPEGFARSGHSSRSCGRRDWEGETMRDICHLLVARLSDPGGSYVQYSTVLRGLLSRRYGMEGLTVLRGCQKSGGRRQRERVSGLHWSFQLQ